MEILRNFALVDCCGATYFGWGGRDRTAEMMESKSATLGVNEFSRVASPNVLKYLANLWAWCKTKSSIRIQEGPPAFAGFASFGQASPFVAKAAAPKPN